MKRQWLPAGPERALVAVGETAILLHPSLLLVGVSIWMERGRQQNDSLTNGYNLCQPGRCTSIDVRAELWSGGVEWQSWGEGVWAGYRSAGGCFCANREGVQHRHGRSDAIDRCV